MLAPPATPTFDQQLLAALPALRRYALSLTRDTTRAEDLAQDTILRAISHKEQYAPGTNLAAWLSTICKNAFLSGVRKRRENEDSDNAVTNALADATEQQDDATKDEYANVSAVLNTLPKKQQDALTLVANGMTYEAAAKQLNVEVGTIKSLVNRARSSLGIATDAKRTKRRALAQIGGTTRFRKIDIASFTRPPKFETELGARPMLLWLPLTRLFIDESYQRNVLEKGITNVYNIVREFDWKKFSAVVCAKVNDTYAIVDGQHRTYAAAIRGIVEIPCLVIEATTEEQAAAFAAINAKATRIDSLQVFHAAVAAKDHDALELVSALAAANVTVHRYHCPEAMLRPRETMAVKACQLIIRLYGAKVLTLALRCINERHYNDAAILRGPTIRAMGDVVAKLDMLRPAMLLERAKGVNFQRMLIEAKVVAAQQGGGIRHTLYDALMKKFDLEEGE